MTDKKYKYHRPASKNDVIDLTSDSQSVISINSNAPTIIDIDFNNNPFDNDDNDDIFDDGLGTMHKLGSISCAVRTFFLHFTAKY